MAKTNQNFTMYSGNTKPIYVTIKDKQNKPVIIDEGDTFKWVMRLRGKSITSKTSGNGISVIDASIGRICIRLLPEDTHGISGECDHELAMYDSDGSVTTVTTGKVTITTSLLDV
jgi:hypothetical protein